MTSVLVLCLCCKLHSQKRTEQEQGQRQVANAGIDGGAQPGPIQNSTHSAGTGRPDKEKGKAKPSRSPRYLLCGRLPRLTVSI